MDHLQGFPADVWEVREKLPHEQQTSPAWMVHRHNCNRSQNQEDQMVAGNGEETGATCRSARSSIRANSHRKGVASEPGWIVELGGKSVGFPACGRRSVLAGNSRERVCEGSWQQSAEPFQRPRKTRDTTATWVRVHCGRTRQNARVSCRKPRRRQNA